MSNKSNSSLKYTEQPIPLEGYIFCGKTNASLYYSVVFYNQVSHKCHNSMFYLLKNVAFMLKEKCYYRVNYRYLTTKHIMNCIQILDSTFNFVAGSAKYILWVLVVWRFPDSDGCLRLARSDRSSTHSADVPLRRALLPLIHRGRVFASSQPLPSLQLF